jgi:hypothetical protein
LGGVAVCQVLLFEGRDPRKASFVGGIIVFAIVAVVMAAVAGYQTHSAETVMQIAFFGAILAPILGGPLGYAAGALVAAVFLVRKESPDAEDAVEPTEPAKPAEPAHVATMHDTVVEPYSIVPVAAADRPGASDARGGPFGNADLLKNERLRNESLRTEPSRSPRQLPMIMATLAEPSYPPASLPLPVGVPRRFSIGTMMILVTAFGVLFGAMKTIGVPPLVFGAIALFIGGVAACQAILFKGKMPRLASFVGGIAMFFLIGVTITVMECFTPHGFDNVFALLGAVIGIGFGAILLGGPLGYVVGCFVASIFLVRKEPEDAEPAAEAGRLEKETKGDVGM